MCVSSGEGRRVWLGPSHAAQPTEGECRAPRRHTQLAASPHFARLQPPCSPCPHRQEGANPALVDLAHSVGTLLPTAVREGIAAFSFTCLPMQLHAVSVCVCGRVGGWWVGELGRCS